MEVSTECQKSFTKAKIALLSGGNGSPALAFLSSFMLSLKFEWSNEVPTAGTDGARLLVNPEFWENKCDVDTRKGILAHEVYHGALLHSFRRGNRDPEIWNYACDFVVNSMVLNLGLKLPPTDLIDSKYDGWTTEQVYDELIKNGQKKPQQSYGSDVLKPEGSPSSGDGDGNAQKGNTPTEADVMAKVAQAHQAAKMMQAASGQQHGYSSPELDRIIEKLFNPSLPWYKILRQYASKMKRDDYSTKRFNKRFLPRFYLPTLYSEAMPDINVYIDTSGSVSKKDFTRFVSECASIRNLLKPKYMRFFSWDTKLYAPSIMTNRHSLLNVSMKGGGGTEISETLENIIETKPEISIIFTDGYFSNRPDLMAKASKATKLIWLIYDNPKWTCPNGRVIHFDKDAA